MNEVLRRAGQYAGTLCSRLRPAPGSPPLVDVSLVKIVVHGEPPPGTGK